MRRAVFVIFAIVATTLSSSAVAGSSSSAPLPSGRRLRNIVAAKFPGRRVLIGGTTGSWSFGTRTGAVMDREFSYVTPENDFKQAIVHPDPNTWRWDRADAWLDHIVAHGQVLRIHGPVSPQCSRWAKDDRRTPAELQRTMRDFMTALCQRYNRKPGVISLDVVNETVIKGRWHTDKKGAKWEVPWFRIGQDTDKNQTPLYIKMAFEIAKQHAPDLKLIYNHHEDANAEASWQRIKETIAYLRSQGLRVDGIGWQAHVNNGWASPDRIAKFGALIDWAHANNLEFHVTEASVWIKNGVTPETLALQAKTYSAIVSALLEKRTTGLVGWNTWHIDDPHSWNRHHHGGLFNKNYAPKPAYHAIQNALEQTE